MMPEGHSVTTYLASKLLARRGKLKVIAILLFGCSILFLSYQFLNYSTLTNYQSHRQYRGGGSNFISRHQSGGIGSGGGGGGGFHLKDIALKLEQEKQRHLLDGHQHQLPHPLPLQSGGGKSKGEQGSLSGGGRPNKKDKVGGGKPIFVDHILGVPKSAQQYYLRHNQRDGSFFSCLTSGKQISWDKVNDDFCDCPSDGSDEPSTAACMNGRFFCTAVKKGFPEYVPSSMVNDGICDCVDGSDEHLKMNSISCKNRS